MNIPFLSAAVNGWQLASRAFAGGGKSYRRKQQWKSFFGALLAPQFASKWFKTLKSPDFIIVAKHCPWLYFKPFRRTAANMPFIFLKDMPYILITTQSGASRADGSTEMAGMNCHWVPVRKNIQEVKVNKRALYRRRYRLLDDLSMKIADTVKNLSSDGL